MSQINQDQPAGGIDFSAPRPATPEEELESVASSETANEGSSPNFIVAPDEPDNRLGASTPSSQHESFISAISSFGAHRMGSSREQTPNTTPRPPPALTFTDVPLMPANPNVQEPSQGLAPGDSATSPGTPLDAFHQASTAHQPLGSPFGPHSVEYGWGPDQYSTISTSSARSLLSKDSHSHPPESPTTPTFSNPTPGTTQGFTLGVPPEEDSPSPSSSVEQLAPLQTFKNGTHGEDRPTTSGTFGRPGSRGNGSSRPVTAGSSGYMSSSRLGTAGSSRLGTAGSSRLGTAGSSRMGTADSTRSGFGHGGWGARLHSHTHGSRMPPGTEPYGNIDAGGHIDSPFAFDINRPPPLSGRENINQSAYLVNQRATDYPELSSIPMRFFNRGKRPTTADTDMSDPPGTAQSTDVQPSRSAAFLPSLAAPVSSSHATPTPLVAGRRRGSHPEEHDQDTSSNWDPRGTGNHHMPAELAHRDANEAHPRWGYTSDQLDTAHPPPNAAMQVPNPNGAHGIVPSPDLRDRDDFSAGPDYDADSFSAATGDDMSDFSAMSDGMSVLTPSQSRNPRSHNQRRMRRATATSQATGISEDITIPDGETTGGEPPSGSKPPDAPHDFEDDDSPFAEVRASVSNVDDFDMEALTLRSFFLGMLLSCLAAAGNTFFLFRYPAPHIPILVVQVVAYPLGRLMSKTLPMRVWELPHWLGGFHFSLNPCVFNIKEHTIIVMMASVAILPAYGLHTLISAEAYYFKKFGVGFNILYILASQLTGFSMAGIARKFLVYPASMIWPGVLVNTTLLNTLHAQPDAGTGKLNRLMFFVYVCGGAFVWYFVPGYLFKALSWFSYACWIAPTNHAVNSLMGVRTGLGMGIFTFDWTQVAWIGSPLTSPFWAQVNVGVGFLIFYWIITPIMYFKKVWFTNYLPIQAVEAADRFQQPFDAQRIVNNDLSLNATEYATYSPVYLTASFNMTYMLAFALTTSLIVYTGLNHGQRLWRTARNIDTEPKDIHARLMEPYPEVPNTWYMMTFVVCFIFGVVALEVWHTGLPIWGLIVANAMALVYVIPTGIIFAMTNLEPTFNLIAELIAGYAFPGRPLSNMMFKTFAVQSLAEALYFVKDMKLGHYMKIPPRSMFLAQVTGCFVTCFVQVGVKTWMFATIPDLCMDGQDDMLICQSARVSYTASVIWGLVGPQRLFEKGGIYRPQLWMMLVGVLTPIPFWAWCRRNPKSWMRRINVVVVFSVCMFIPPASGINIASFLTMGFIFQWYIRTRHFTWWSKYNYVLSAALDVGTFSCAIIIFLIFGVANIHLMWWGNTVQENTLDWQGTAIDSLPEGATFFGPSHWK